MSTESKKDKPAKGKEKEPKKHAVVRFEALKADTEKGKELLKRETQAALIYGACAKGPVTFAEILDAIRPSLKGKKAETLENNARWYVSDLKKKGMLKAVETREGK